MIDKVQEQKWAAEIRQGLLLYLCKNPESARRILKQWERTKGRAYTNQLRNEARELWKTLKK